MTAPDCPPITVGIPVYNGSAFVGDTLRSLQNQSFGNYSAIISVDCSDDDSVAICREFAADPRFEVTAQPHRLGWIDNCRWLLGSIRSRWLMLLSHDDLLELTTLDRLYTGAQEHPKAASVYGDAVTLGNSPGSRFSAPSLFGGPLGRLVTYLIEHHDGLAFRGLIRTEAAHASGGPEHNTADDFAAEAVWVLKLAWQGELVRIKGADWRKRMRSGTVSDGWLHWPARRRAQAWVSHCSELMGFVASLDLPPSWMSLLAHAGLLRLLRATPTLGPYDEISALDHNGRLAMVEAYRRTLDSSLPTGDARRQILATTDAIATEVAMAPSGHHVVSANTV